MTAGDDPLPPLREVIRQHGLSAQKSLGQNFLLDINLTRRIARLAAPLDTSTIIEVGPGPGGLTRGLMMEGARRVIAIERDRRCLPVLEDISAAFPGRLSIVEGDALALDLASLLHRHSVADGEDVKIVANLPYNIGTQLLIKWLAVPSWPPRFHSLTLMFQKEVAERVTAAPGTKAYGRLSILGQWRCRSRLALRLPAAAFVPPPKVDSAVLHIEPTAPLDPELEISNLERVVASAFAQRRKMLRASLKSISSEPEALLEAADLDPTARAEALSVADFVRLAKLWQSSG